MKIQEGDYVDVSGMNEAERREVVQALLDCGVDVGEGFDFCDSLSMKTICVDKDGIFHDFGRSFKGRKLTLSDLRSPEWDGNGLPPVGVECEFYRADLDRWVGCETIGIFRNEMVCAPDGGDFLSGKAENFRPLKTDQEKAISEMLKNYPLADIATLEAMLKAGYKKDTNL